jgi:two-component system sensor histidine kinase UhpB
MHNKPIKVLLVEDNLAHARAIGEGLCANLHDRFDLMCAERLGTGLEILARGGIDLILLDLNLPDSQGLATFERFHRAAPQVAIVIMTGVDDPTLGQHAVAAGARDVLVKGQIEPSLLARVIQHIVEKQRLEAVSRVSSRGYGSVFDHALEAMLLVDDQARCLAANTAAANLLGRSLQQIKGKAVHQMFVDGDDWNVRWQRWCKDGLLEGSVQFLKSDGEVGDLEFSITPDCIGACHLLVIRDTTARRRAEESLRSACEQWKSLAARYQSSHAQLLRQRDEAADELAKSVAQLKRRVAELGSGRTVDLEECRALESELGDIGGAVAKLKSGEERGRRAVRLGPVEAMRSQAKEFEQRTGIQCTVFSQIRDSASEESPATRLCPILEQALSNVAIQGSATAVQVRLTRESGRLVMEIEDNGPNLTEGQLADPRTFRLSGVKEQILRFGGDFILQGAPGKGTTLRLWIPSRDKPVSRKAP